MKRRCKQSLSGPIASIAPFLQRGAFAATHLLATVLIGAAAPVAAQPVAAYAVAYREVPEAISAEGVAEAVRQSTLAAQIAGQIVELRVKVGDSVKA